jgi:hypothetical protein
VECIFLPDPKHRKVDHDVIVPDLSAVGTIVSGGRAVSSSSTSSHRKILQNALPERTLDAVAAIPHGGLAHSELELEVASTLSSGLRVSSIDHDNNADFNSIEEKESTHPYGAGHESFHISKSSSPSPVAFAGALTQINGMHGAYVKNSMRNAELWNFCEYDQLVDELQHPFTDICLVHYFVVPNMCSVDGSTTSALFVREMLPWMIQSPLMPHIAILMSAASQAAEPTLQTTRMSETIVIKSQVLSLINDFLRQDFSVVGGEALRAVVHLVVIEVSYSFKC